MQDQTNSTGAPPANDQIADSPQQLLARTDLSRENKIAILRQWELDLRERMVAEEENMPPTEPMPISLDEVLIALDSLGATSDAHPVPTTHG